MGSNPVGLIFLMIFFSAFIFFGMGLTQNIIDQGRTNVNGTDMEDEFENNVEITQQGYNFVSYMPWIIGLAIVVVIVLGLVALIGGFKRAGV